MRSTRDAHRRQPWQVHQLASDFELLDVWRFDVQLEERPGRNFAAFVQLHERGMARPPREGASGLLFRLRDWLGKVFGWDDGPPLPIPGCEELSVADRLPAEERQREQFGPFARVYRSADEALYEISNTTVHALMHIGQVEDRAEMAVYVKTRGRFGRLYVACIAPFRHWIVYPAMIRGARRSWDEAGRLLWPSTASLSVRSGASGGSVR